MALAGIVQGGFGDYLVTALDPDATLTSFAGGLPDGIIPQFVLVPIWSVNDDALALLQPADDGLSVRVLLRVNTTYNDTLTLSVKVFNGMDWLTFSGDIPILAPGVASSVEIEDAPP